MPSLLDEFKDFIKDTNGLVVWALGSGVFGAILAKFGGISPPWPPAGTAITCAAMLLSLIHTFLHFRRTAKARTAKSLRLSNYILIICVISYLFFFSMFVESNTKGESVVLGFECTNEAKSVYSNCPYLTYEEIAQANYIVEKLWTKFSITIMQISLFSFWIASFVFFINSVGIFVLYSRAKKTKGG